MGSKMSTGINLLKRGCSYDEIKSELKVAKSTISSWFTGLPEQEKEKIRRFRIDNWRKSIANYQQKRKERILKQEQTIQDEAAQAISLLSEKDLLIIGACLYWAEGAKLNRWELQFSNSDPDMIKIMMVFFRRICLVPEKKFYMQMILHLNINEKKARIYWSKITNVPEAQFKKACYSLSKRSQGIRSKRKLPYGTLQIRIHDKKIVHKVYGYIKGLKQARVVQLVERLVANEKVAGSNPVPRSNYR